MLGEKRKRGVEGMRRKSVLLSVFICLTFATMITTAFLHIYPALRNMMSTSSMFCLEEHKIYMDGQVVCEKSEGVKYLSYHPGGGGWNNQRIALENAVVLAKLLNRTLVVQPLAPHQELHRTFGGYKKYNRIPKDKLLPLSRVIDLKLLSKLIPVKEFSANHVEFKRRYNHLRWAQVCHNGKVGRWVDIIPRKTEKEKWRLLGQQMKSLPSYEALSKNHRICQTELKKFESDRSRPVWGVMDELSQRNEDLIYFSEGSLITGGPKFMFFDKETILNIHDWTMRFIRYAPEVRERAKAVIETIKHPFNAIHVRRTDHKKSLEKSQEFWLQGLKSKKALKLTKTLYVATDEGNKTWFNPFLEAGYKLLFAEDFAEQLQLKNIPSAFVQDMSGLREQLICADADNFVASPYSTFSRFIVRERMQLRWKKRTLLRNPYVSFTWIESP